jgi:hypothetical protein
MAIGKSQKSFNGKIIEQNAAINKVVLLKNHQTKFSSYMFFPLKSLIKTH